MNETLAHVERIFAFAGGVVVFVVAAIALRNDWKAKGLGKSSLQDDARAACPGRRVGNFGELQRAGRKGRGNLMYDQLDDRGVPTSRGVPKAVMIAVVIGILAIFWVGEYTIQWAGYGHSGRRPSRCASRSTIRTTRSANAAR